VDGYDSIYHVTRSPVHFLCAITKVDASHCMYSGETTYFLPVVRIMTYVCCLSTGFHCRVGYGWFHGFMAVAWRIWTIITRVRPVVALHSDFTGVHRLFLCFPVCCDRWRGCCSFTREHTPPDCFAMIAVTASYSPDLNSTEGMMCVLTDAVFFCFFDQFLSSYCRLKQ